jgi:hypothetical protein
MSPRPDRRTALLLGLGGVLTGCGFQPVYRSASGGAEPASGLAEIEVKPIYERPGQILRESLLARFNSQTGMPRHYDLQVTFWITGEGLGVLAFTQPTRVRLIGSANWILMARDKPQTRLTEGTERVMDGFDIFDAQYFAIDLDNEHVQRRIAESMAERITMRLAMWFHQHPPAVG